MSLEDETMTLDYYRTKRSLIKQVIDRKHDEWMEHVLQDDYCGLIAKKMSDNIESLYVQLEACDADIVRVKQELTK